MESLLAKGFVRRPSAVPNSDRGIGVYRDVQKVQDPHREVVRDLLGAMGAASAMRMGRTTGRRLFTGSAIGSPQAFVRPPAEINALDHLAADRVGRVNARRTASAGRGRPING